MRIDGLLLKAALAAKNGGDRAEAAKALGYRSIEDGISSIRRYERKGIPLPATPAARRYLDYLGVDAHPNAWEAVALAAKEHADALHDIQEHLAEIRDILERQNERLLADGTWEVVVGDDPKMRAAIREEVTRALRGLTGGLPGEDAGEAVNE